MAVTLSFFIKIVIKINININININIEIVVVRLALFQTYYDLSLICFSMNRYRSYLCIVVSLRASYAVHSLLKMLSADFSYRISSPIA